MCHSYFIKKVTFKLHDTYAHPLRSKAPPRSRSCSNELTVLISRLVAAIERPPFEVTETGWGEFDIVIKIFFVGEAAEKPITFAHHLKLHPWLPAVPPLPADHDPANGELPVPEPNTPALVLSPVHSWQYEEVVFVEPTEAFYTLLLEHAPKPLPATNRHPRTLVHALGGGGNIGEFSVEMERGEGAKMDEARKKVLEEIETMRKTLVDREKELTGEYM